MKNTKYIIELAKCKLSIEGYDYIVSLLKYYLKKYSWPKTILDENINNYDNWTDEEVLSFTHQLFIFIIEKEKLKNYANIPNNYLQYYFKTIVLSYVANKIKEFQNNRGVSFDDIKRVCLQILDNKYFSHQLKNEIYWCKENVFVDPVEDNELVRDLLTTLPKIPILEEAKHYKPSVLKALDDLFNAISRPIEQSVLVNIIFNLFDQSSYFEQETEPLSVVVREVIASQAVAKIVANVDQFDVPIYLDYFFSETKDSLMSLAEKYNLPKSTVHYKTSQFTKKITTNFHPDNEQEGVWFLKKLHKTLDELK